MTRSTKAKEAKRWADEHRQLLDAVWQHFERDAGWPEIEALQRQFERDGIDVDAAALAFEIPNALGFRDQDRLVLCVRGLSFVPEAGDLLNAWAAALRLAYRHYVEDDEPKLESAELREELGLNERQAHLVSVLLLRERWAFGSGHGGPAGDWTQEVRSGVRVARGTGTAGEMLAARDAVEYPAAPGSAAMRAGRALQPEAPAAGPNEQDAERRRQVMVVYGRDGAVNRALFSWLRTLDLRPQEWTELILATGSGSPYTGEVLDRALQTVQAVTVLFTPDDLVRLRDDLLGDHDGPEEREVRGQPRPNVLYEAGLAFGRHPDHTVIVEFGRLRGLSDLFGRHAVRLERGVAALQDLAARLRAAGCSVNTAGTDWLNASGFPPAPEPSGAPLDAPLLRDGHPPAAEQHLAPDPLVRLVREILEAAVGGPVADDVAAHIAERLRGLSSPTRGDDLFDGLPGRPLPIEVIKRAIYEFEQHGVLRRNPDDRVRGYVLGQLP